MKNFYDKYGNINPNSWDSTSENPSTFNASHFFSLVENGRPYNKQSFKNLFLQKYKDGRWVTNENSPNFNWSLDERLCTLAFFNFIGEREWVNKVPIIGFDTWSHLRPDVLAYSFYVKYLWLPVSIRDYLLEIIIDDAFISCREFARNPKDESSGAQLAFIHLMGIKQNQILFECEKIVGGWDRVFRSYYPEISHPTNKAWK